MTSSGDEMTPNMTPSMTPHTTSGQETPMCTPVSANEQQAVKWTSIYGISMITLSIGMFFAFFRRCYNMYRRFFPRRRRQNVVVFHTANYPPNDAAPAG
ncbi:unnamed protein product [Diamesa tonsa]